MNNIKFPLLTPEYLHKRRIEDGATIEQISEEVGCSVGNVMKRIRDWKVFRRGVVKRVSWNTGLTKETDERLARLSKNRTGDGNPMSGKDAWNKGLTADKDERVAAVSDALRGREFSDQTREKMAAAKRGKCREQANRWRGGTSKIGKYREFRKTVDGRRIYMHRWVAEQFVGRRLARDEHVHHIDRDEENNSPSNLLILSEPDHATLHGAIYRGECDSKQEQIEWLKKSGINFLEVK